MNKETWNSSSEKANELKISDFGTLAEVQKMARMPLAAHSFSEVRKVLVNLVGKPITNKSGLSVTLSKKSIKEILSGKAVGKSFDIKAHLKAAVNIEKLFSNTIEKWKFEINPNKNNDSLKGRKYLYAPMEYGDRFVPVKFTIKVYKDKWTEKRLYSIEAINVSLQ